MQLVAPVLGPYVPDAQLVQAVEELEEEYVPARQLEHELAEDAEYWPEVHWPVTADPPVQ